MPRTLTSDLCRSISRTDPIPAAKNNLHTASAANQSKQPDGVLSTDSSTRNNGTSECTPRALLDEPKSTGINLRSKPKKQDSWLKRILRIFFVSSRTRSKKITPENDRINNGAAENLHAEPTYNTALVSHANNLEALNQANKNFGLNLDQIEHWPISAQERAFFAQSFALEKNDFREQLIDGWYQTVEGNCVFVAAAKAAMDAYGTHVYKKVEATRDGLSITMRDNKVVKISAKELLEAKKAGHFAGENTKLLAYATMMYAASAKRAEVEEHEGVDDFEEALESLNDGEYLQDDVKFLGLSKNLVAVDPRTLNDKDAVLACSKNHAIYIDKRANGTHIADHYGDAVNYNGSDTRGRRSRSKNRIHTAYTFKPLALPIPPVENDSRNERAA